MQDMKNYDNKVFAIIENQCTGPVGKCSLFYLMNKFDSVFDVIESCHRLTDKRKIYRNVAEEEGLEIYYYV